MFALRINRLNPPNCRAHKLSNFSAFAKINTGIMWQIWIGILQIFECEPNKAFFPHEFPANIFRTVRFHSIYWASHWSAAYFTVFIYVLKEQNIEQNSYIHTRNIANKHEIVVFTADQFHRNDIRYKHQSPVLWTYLWWKTSATVCECELLLFADMFIFISIHTISIYLWWNRKKFTWIPLYHKIIECQSIAKCNKMHSLLIRSHIRIAAIFKAINFNLPCYIGLKKLCVHLCLQPDYIIIIMIMQFQA